MVECLEDEGIRDCWQVAGRYCDGLRQGRDMKKKVDGKSVRRDRRKKKMQPLRCDGDREMMEVMDKQEQANAWGPNEIVRFRSGRQRWACGESLSATPSPEREITARNVTATKAAHQLQKSHTQFRRDRLKNKQKKIKNMQLDEAR